MGRLVSLRKRRALSGRPSGSRRPSACVYGGTRPPHGIQGIACGRRTTRTCTGEICVVHRRARAERSSRARRARRARRRWRRALQPGAGGRGRARAGAGGRGRARAGAGGRGRARAGAGWRGRVCRVCPSFCSALHLCALSARSLARSGALLLVGRARPLRAGLRACDYSRPRLSYSAISRTLRPSDDPPLAWRSIIAKSVRRCSRAWSRAVFP
jgi:hypothetical protein